MRFLSKAKHIYTKHIHLQSLSQNETINSAVFYIPWGGIFGPGAGTSTEYPHIRVISRAVRLRKAGRP